MAASLFKWFIACLFMTGTGFRSPKIQPFLQTSHPLYMTVTEINHNIKEKTLEISCKIFTNDFEAALEKVFKQKVDLSDPKDKSAADKWVSEYINKHLQIKVDGKPVSLQFVGSEKETDATWSYFQVSNIADLKNLEIMNNLLYETFEGEINIMHVNVHGDRKSTKLTNPDINTAFAF